jgi:hypothetical protein
MILLRMAAHWMREVSLIFISSPRPVGKTRIDQHTGRQKTARQTCEVVFKPSRAPAVGASPERSDETVLEYGEEASTALAPTAKRSRLEDYF